MRKLITKYIKNRRGHKGLLLTFGFYLIQADTLKNIPVFHKKMFWGVFIDNQLFKGLKHPENISKISHFDPLSAGGCQNLDSFD